MVFFAALTSPLKQIQVQFRHPAITRLLRYFSWLLGALLVVMGLLLLLLRYVLLPQVNNYRGDIERALSAATHLPVSIGRVDGRMQGLRPRLELRYLAVKDQAGRPALSFDNVVGVVGWVSLLKGSPHFHLLEIAAPVLAVRRNSAGELFFAGLPVKTDKSGPDLSAWALDQHAITIRDAKVTWTDEMRQAPPLSFDHLNLHLEKTVTGRHRFGVTALPPSALASLLDLRGEFRGDSINQIEQWRGELYGQMSYADLAGWHPWVDYPVDLTRGRGAARVWLDFEGLRLTSMTADVSLADMQTRLARGLPLLPLRQLNGRFSIRQLDKGFELTTRQLSLATSDGINVAPMDLHLQRDEAGGDFRINKLDFHALSSLAKHLPLPENLRQQLLSYAPHGSLNQFQFDWRGGQWPFARYNIKGEFDKLAIASVGNQPGISGLSGNIAGDEMSGTLLLTGRESLLTLPTVFHQPLTFDALDARVRWKKSGAHTELQLTQVQFRNADAQGTASGRYEIPDAGAGRIDLDAKLSRAEAAAVWRYMPLQAGADVGPFLHTGLTQGKVSKATLKLKGDLDKFPFADRSGIFRIHGIFHDAALRYAEGWPPLEGVTGAIDFDGPLMTVTASDAHILGVRVGPATAILPDLDTLDEVLMVEGKASGATTGFLKFIESSPVAAQIDHITTDMTASGNGELNIKLALPLRRINDSTVNGTFRFDKNRLLLDPDVPPLDDVRGQLEFNAKSVNAKGITATMFGLPLKLDLKTQSDGNVLAEASGDATAAQLRKQFPFAGLKNLTGGAHWSGTVKARKKTAEVRIASDLVGLGSTLPEPFYKSAKEAMPLLFERKATDARLITKKLRDKSNRSLTEFSLGRALHAQLIYRDDEGKSIFERGLVSVGDVAARLPERGLTLAIFQPHINVDLWRSLATDPTEKHDVAKSAATPATAPSPLTPSRIDLRSVELQTMGRLFHDVKLTATKPANAWLADISSRELAAKLEWVDAANPGSAKLSGRVMRFILPDAAPSGATATDAMKGLPNLDLTLDHLSMHGHDYGELHLAAENKSNDWNTSFSVRNDDGALEGTSRWRLSPPPVAATAPTAAMPAAASSETQMDFKLHARSIERFLNRIGYPNTVKRGNADLGGRLNWKGAPQDFDLALLNGQLSLEARDGQFNKLEPGVGRLLGVLSLQAIPRRITLDFRDVFSEGFAFDSVKGQIAIGNGVLDTQNMEIRGPAARVQMAGRVDLTKETQDLKVRVQPTVSESAAVAALMVPPAVGATAWVFNKLFGNPFDKAFAYDFAVTGNWADPKVDKVGAQAGAAVSKDAEK